MGTSGNQPTFAIFPVITAHYRGYEL